MMEVPRCSNINFYHLDGKPEIRGTLVKPDIEKEKNFGNKVERGKQKGQEDRLGV